MSKLRSIFLTVLILLGLTTAGCKDAYRIAWISGSGTWTAAYQTEHVLATQLKAKTAECLKLHQPKTPEYATCVKKLLDANLNWIKYYRPAINSSLIVFTKSLSLAEARKDKKLPWKDYLMPALCALSECYDQWKDLLDDPTLKPLLDGLFLYLNKASCKKVMVVP